MECGRLDNGLVWTAYTESSNQENPNYILNYADTDQEIGKHDTSESNRCYENPLFIPREVLESNREEAMDTELDYKLCENEGESVVYLSTSRAAKLQRALRNAGYKKVRYFSVRALTHLLFAAIQHRYRHLH